MKARGPIAAALAGVVLTGCASQAVGEAPAPSRFPRVPLQNAGFENAPRPGEHCPERWNCSAHSNAHSYRFSVDAAGAVEGRQALCIERVANEPWSLATQALADPALRGKTLRFSIAVRADALEGAGAGPFVVVHGPHGNLAHREELVKRTPGWLRIAVEFPVGGTMQFVQVGATMQGPGRACFDDARLEVVAAP